MSNSRILVFFFILLPLAALGHDSYVAYYRTELGDFFHAFRLTQLGWLWQTYSLDSYKWARTNFSDGFWKNFLDPLLKQMTVLIASVPLIVFLIVFLVRKTVGKMQMLGAGMGGSKSGKYSVGGLNADKKNTRVKYKRR